VGSLKKVKVTVRSLMGYSKRGYLTRKKIAPDKKLQIMNIMDT
jgi:hypothetical protein